MGKGGKLVRYQEPPGYSPGKSQFRKNAARKEGEDVWQRSSPRSREALSRQDRERINAILRWAGYAVPPPTQRNFSGFMTV
jgi:hypothetical protein